MASVTNSDIDNFIKNFLEKGLKKENPIDVLVKILVDDKEAPKLKTDFKEKYLKPLLKSWENLTKDIDSNKTKITDVFSKLENLFDTINVEQKKLKQSNKTETVDEQAKTYSGNVLTEIKKIYNDKENKELPTINPTVEEVKPELPTITPIIEEVKPELPTITPIIEEVKPELPIITPIIEEVKPEEKLIEENKPETIISFSVKTSEFLSSLVDKLINKQQEALKDLQLNNEPTKKGSFLHTILDIAKSLPLMFAAIGGASALAGMFWPEIKKYIGEKFGDKAAEIFDQFQGTINAIGKFISIGGLQVTMGKTFKTLGDLLGKVADDFASGAIKIFGGIFDNLLGIGASAADDVAGSTIGKGLGKALKTGGSLLFKGLSKTALKAIPLIGSVISFSDAWGRFKEGEYAQGIIDIGAGIAAFVPGIGTVLSIGLSVMNAIIDFKSPEEKKELIQKTFNIAGMLAKGVGVYAKLMGAPVLKRIPFLGSLFNFASAWEKYQQNNILGGTLDLASGIAAFVPGVGLPVSIGLDILSSIIGTQEAKESGLQKSGIDFAKIALKSLSFFTKLGKPFFKRIPLLGSLLSFADAWDNFKNDNILSGSLDLVSGISNLFPGIGTALSIGVDLLNSFMSQKTESGKTRFEAVGDWFSKVWEWVKETPVMKSFFDLYDGIAAVFKGDMKGAFKKLSNIPLIGGMFESIGKALSLDTKNSPTIESSKSINLTTDKTQKITENLPTQYNKEEEEKLSEQGKNIISKRKELQKELQETKEQSSTVIGRDQKIQELDKQIERLMAEQSDLNIQIQRQKELKEGKTFEKPTKHANFASNDRVLPKLFGFENIKNDDDMYYEPRFDKNNFGSSIINNKDKSITTTNPNDKFFATKPGDSVDNTFKKLNESIDNLNKKIESLVRLPDFNKFNEDKQEKNNQTTIINNNNSSNNKNEPIKLTGGRDEIFLTRMDWLRNNSYSRI
jgi:hypothetical protein